ncbi:hypothetical protein ABEB36_012300 [Hypothenemus hampei]|uniref:RING-type E3 ubiquitin transferase n=1 Tax=Hypothenemus hampei TaxID=57062 RepID=A0ABD1EB06_HYPHA
MNGAICKTTVDERNENITHQPGDKQVSNNSEIVNDSNSPTSTIAAVGTEKICGICLEDILQKPHTSEHTFGILPDCNHCFCFPCISHWKGNITSSWRVDRSCPVCRQKIEFIFPSSTWFESNEEKQLYISQGKIRMGQINCPYFQKENTHCPFGNKCFYLHTRPGEIEQNVLPAGILFSDVSEFMISTRQDAVPSRELTLNVSVTTEFIESERPRAESSEQLFDNAYENFETAVELVLRDLAEFYLPHE